VSITNYVRTKQNNIGCFFWTTPEAEGSRGVLVVKIGVPIFWKPIQNKQPNKHPIAKINRYPKKIMIRKNSKRFAIILDMPLNDTFFERQWGSNWWGGTVTDFISTWLLCNQVALKVMAWWCSSCGWIKLKLAENFQAYLRINLIGIFWCWKNQFKADRSPELLLWLSEP